MEERDQKILRHILRFRVSLPIVIQSLYFPDGRSAYAPVMDRLRKDGWIVSYRVLKGSRSYHQLTRRAVRDLGFPGSYAEPLGRQALLRQLAILWFCHMNGRPRSFVADNAALAPVFRQYQGEQGAARTTKTAVGSPDNAIVPTGCHCMDSADGFPIYHIYAVMPDTRRDNLFKTIRMHYQVARQNPAIAARMGDRQYGFAILVHSENKKQVVERFVHGKLMARTDSNVPLTARAPFVVESVPDFEKSTPPQSRKGESRHGTLG